MRLLKSWSAALDDCHSDSRCCSSSDWSTERRIRARAEQECG
jgi:hypothetical protein